MKYISNRIRRITAMIRPFTNIADVGCDHGYLIVHAFLEHMVTFAQAIDNKIDPLNNAKQNISKYCFAEDVIFTLANGIEEIDSRVEVLVIAGLGGLNIVQILSAHPESLRNIKRIVLQPNTHTYEVRKWANDNKWEIIDEVIVEENGKFYEILMLERARELIFYSEAELKFGPVLIQKRSETFKKKWNNLSKKYLEISTNEHIGPEKVAYFKDKVNLIKEIIHENK